MAVSDHFVQFFDDDAVLVEAVSGFLERGAKSDEVCVVIATSVHLRDIAANLGRRSIDLAALDADYRYIAIDAEVLLQEFVSGDQLNLHRLHERADMLLRQAAAQGRPVRIFGETVVLLVERGMTSAAIELEELWNELGRFHQFVLFCAYSHRLLDAHRDSRLYERVCAVHHHIAADHLH